MGPSFLFAHEKWIALPLLADGSRWAVTGDHDGLIRQSEDATVQRVDDLVEGTARQVGASDGTGEERVAVTRFRDAGRVRILVRGFVLSSLVTASAAATQQRGSTPSARENFIKIDAPVVALIRPSRSMVTCECSQPPVGSADDGPRPQTSTYIASPMPTSRPCLRAASRSAFSCCQLQFCNARSSAFS